jgi:Bacterial Ig-like domain
MSLDYSCCLPKRSHFLRAYILSVLPDINSTGVILQGAIIVTFDQEIDVTTYDESSFLLSAPAELPRIAPGGLVGSVAPVTGTDYVAGTFSFALNSTGATIATFVPARPMRPNIKYTVLISTAVQTPGSTPVTLSDNYTWSFVTGVLNLTVPPPQQPGPGQVGRIRKEDLRVSPRSSINNDLHQIVIEFPANINPSSFNGGPGAHSATNSAKTSLASISSY